MSYESSFDDIERIESRLSFEKFVPGLIVSDWGIFAFRDNFVGIYLYLCYETSVILLFILILLI